MKAIILTGNIASGKSTAAEYLSEKTGYDIISIDPIRIELYRAGHYGVKLERLAEKHFLSSIKLDRQYIYESTGNTLFHKRVNREVFFGCDRLSLHIDTEITTCTTRFYQRKRTSFQVKPAFAKSSIEESIRRNDFSYSTKNFDFVIDNNGSIESLYKQLDDFLNTSSFF